MNINRERVDVGAKNINENVKQSCVLLITTPR